MWALDHQYDTTSDGRTLKLLSITDEFTREAIAIQVERSIDADRAVNVLEQVVVERAAPAFIRCDNGPELTAIALQDWCRFNGAGTSYIDQGSPWQTPTSNHSTAN